MRKPTVLLIAAGLAAPALPAAELVEQIVVRVNDRLITQSEYDKRLAIASRAPNHPTDAAELERSVLEDLIKEKLLEERAKEMSVSATEEEVDAAVARIKEQYKLTSDADFDKALAESGMTREELRRQMRQSITLQKVVGRDVASQLQLTDDQLRLEYERKKEQFYAVPESAHVAEIVIRFSPSDGEARQKAVEKVEEIRVKVKGGASFAELAKENSEGNTRDKGGELGTVSKGELVEALDVVIFVTPPEEYPAPALLPDSIHFFHVTERKASGYKPFSEVKEDLRKRIQDDLYEKRFGEYMDKLRRDAFVKIYVPELAKLDEKKPT
ncbi:MAG TPA: SurA N-terminal domain-containing protein [Thermoanaerobaculia bacterium]|nr:SurA N-terminal domain-containing protein [Thermoanaerobaculia bacterium]